MSYKGKHELQLSTPVLELRNMLYDEKKKKNLYSTQFKNKLSYITPKTTLETFGFGETSLNLL